MEVKAGKRADAGYAWVVLAVSFVTMGITQGTRSAYGIFLEPLIAEFGWERAVAALPPAVALVVFGLVQPVVGRLVDRRGARPVIAAGVLLMGLSTLPLVRAGQVWQFVLLVGVLGGLGAGASGLVSNTVLVSEWFERRRGLALGLASAGISGGQAVLAPLLTMVILAGGWRAGFLAVALLLLAVNLPLAWGFLRDGPLRPDGPAAAGQAGAKRGGIWWAGLRVPPLWWLNIGYFVCGLTDFFVFNHLVIYARDLGYPEMVGAVAMSVVAAAGIGGSVLLGAWSDRVSPRLLMGCAYLSRAAGFVLLGFAAGSAWALFLTAALTGASFLATIPLTSTLTRRIFGQRLMGTFYGVVSLCHQVGAGLGTFFGGLVFDLSGSYRLAFLLGALALVLAGLVSFLVQERPLAYVGERGAFLPAGPAGR